MFWSLIISFFIANVFLVLINIPFINIWVRISMIPTRILSPNILIFMLVGVFAYNYLMFDIMIFLVLCGMALIVNYFSFSPSPLILGFIIGPIMEENFRRSMLLSGGDLTAFFQRPMSGGFLVVAILFLGVGIYRSVSGRVSRSMNSVG